MKFFEEIFEKVINKPNYETNHENNIYDHGFSKGVAVTLLAVVITIGTLHKFNQESN